MIRISFYVLALLFAQGIATCQDLVFFLTILTWNCGQQVPDFLFLLASRIFVECVAERR